MGELGFFLFSERARTKSLDTAFDPSKLLGSEADALGCGRGADDRPVEDHNRMLFVPVVVF